MLRAAMALLSTLQIGARIKQSLERSLRQAAVIAVAVVFLVAAAVFGLIAAYHALVSIYQFDAAEAAAIMAGVLLLVGLIVIAIALSMGREPKRATQPRRSFRPPIPQPCSIRASARPCSRLAPCPSSPSPSSPACSSAAGSRLSEVRGHGRNGTPRPSYNHPPPSIWLPRGLRWAPSYAFLRPLGFGVADDADPDQPRRVGLWLSPLRKYEVLPSVPA